MPFRQPCSSNGHSGIAEVDLVGRYSNFPPLTKLDEITPVRRRSVPHPRVHKAQQRLGAKRVAELIADYRAGAPSTALMTKFKLGKGTVLKILEDHGVARRNQPLSPEQRDEAIELYLSGWSMAKVGRHFGRQHTVIRDLLRRNYVVRDGASSGKACPRRPKRSQ